MNSSWVPAERWSPFISQDFLKRIDSPVGLKEVNDFWFLLHFATGWLCYTEQNGSMIGPSSKKWYRIRFCLQVRDKTTSSQDDRKLQQNISISDGFLLHTASINISSFQGVTPAGQSKTLCWWLTALCSCSAADLLRSTEEKQKVYSYNTSFVTCAEVQSQYCQS